MHEFACVVKRSDVYFENRWIFKICPIDCIPDLIVIFVIIIRSWCAIYESD